MISSFVFTFHCSILPLITILKINYFINTLSLTIILKNSFKNLFLRTCFTSQTFFIILKINYFKNFFNNYFI